MSRIRIREASWPADRRALEAVRCDVFIKEQNVPRSLEFDGLDASALHWLALTEREEPTLFPYTTLFRSRKSVV